MINSIMNNRNDYVHGNSNLIQQGADKTVNSTKSIIRKKIK
jgi:hypothetical protein